MSALENEYRRELNAIKKIQLALPIERKLALIQKVRKMLEEEVKR